MKTVVIFLLFAAVSFKATAAPAEEPVKTVEVKDEPKPAEVAQVQMVEVKEEPKPEAVEDLPPLAPEVMSQYCLPGWGFFRGSCYLFNRNSNTWRSAANYCANFGATLASVHNPLEYNHFQYMVGSAGSSSAWIGGYHFESSWRWQDGSYFDYYNFMAGGSGTTYKCLRMNTQAGQGWYSSNCNTALPSICQIKVQC
ncbi:ladderlectin-like isoform X1 [Periophthalmus magnuspinnatus]|uniref:ladderlectin-like isoform X1 n=1 Tax=Periophthalmus magnuspinnatus TaxID=409849 RepID=UPI00243684AE|nr:ladderlectin-like isoform X1 [Periophthalmus magnuspinnatus]